MMGFPILPESFQSLLEIFVILALFFLIVKNHNYKNIFRQHPSKYRIYVIFICFTICILDIII